MLSAVSLASDIAAVETGGRGFRGTPLNVEIPGGPVKDLRVGPEEACSPSLGVESWYFERRGTRKEDSWL